jgi:hypothetical protein
MGIIALVILDIALWKSRFFGGILELLAKFRKPIIYSISLIFLLLVVFTAFNTYLGMKFFDLEAILASPKSSYQSGGMLGLMLANFYSLIFGIHPIAFLAVVFLTLVVFVSRKELNDKKVFSVYLMLFILLYYLASTVNHVSSTVRYQIILYPIIFVIAAVGLEVFWSILRIRKNNFINFLVYIFLILASAYSLNFIRPFYFSYASSLLPKEYVLNLKDMGDGSYEAADYLNSLPDARNLLVWSDKRGVCTFFVGRCKSGLGIKKGEESFDYFVVSSGRESRTSKIVLSRVNAGSTVQVRLDKLYDFSDADFYLKIGNRPNNFVKVIDAKKIEE